MWATVSSASAPFAACGGVSSCISPPPRCAAAKRSIVSSISSTAGAIVCDLGSAMPNSRYSIGSIGSTFASPRYPSSTRLGMMHTPKPLSTMANVDRSSVTRQAACALIWYLARKAWISASTEEPWTTKVSFLSSSGVM